MILVCANLECPYRVRVGRPAEYTEKASRCSDCGGALAAEQEARAEPERQRPKSHPPWRRLLVTASVLLLWLVLGTIALPGVNAQAFAELFGTWLPWAPWPAVPSSASVVALDLAPVIAAFVAVDAVLVFMPSQRRLRYGSPKQRQRFLGQVVLVAILFAALQGYGVASFLMGMGREFNRSMVNLEPGAGAMALLVASLVVGCMIIWLLANVISVRGFGNGFSVLAMAVSVMGLWELPSMMAGLYDGQVPTMLLLAVFAVVATVFLIRWGLATARQDLSAPADLPQRLPLPTAGLWIFGVWLSLSEVVYNLAPDNETLQGFFWEPQPLFETLLILPLAALGTYLAAHPKRMARAWRPWVDASIGNDVLAQHARKLCGTSLKWSVGLVAALCSLAALGVYSGLSWVGTAALATCVAVVLDGIAEWRARSTEQELETVWLVDRLYLLDPILAKLRAEGIVAHRRGYYYRAALQFFGPYVPVELMVAAPDAARAREVLAAAYERAADSAAQ